MSQFPGSRNVRTHQYKSLLQELPARTVSLADDMFNLFLENPHHPSLELHDLNDGGRGRHRANSYAVSVTKRIRAIFAIDGDTNVWYWIGTHESYNTYTGRK